MLLQYLNPNFDELKIDANGHAFSPGGEKYFKKDINLEVGIW